MSIDEAYAAAGLGLLDNKAGTHADSKGGIADPNGIPKTAVDVIQLVNEFCTSRHVTQPVVDIHEIGDNGAQQGYRCVLDFAGIPVDSVPAVPGVEGTGLSKKVAKKAAY